MVSWVDHRSELVAVVTLPRNLRTLEEARQVSPATMRTKTCVSIPRTFVLTLSLCPSLKLWRRSGRSRLLSVALKLRAVKRLTASLTEATRRLRLLPRPKSLLKRRKMTQRPKAKTKPQCRCKVAVSTARSWKHPKMRKPKRRNKPEKSVSARRASVRLN